MAVAEFRFYEELNDFLTPARRRRAFDYDAHRTTVKDRFGNSVTPCEWLLVPLFVIDEAVELIKDGTITGCQYDAKLASLARTAS